MPRIERPFFPIIYVRGYAMTRDEIVQTTSTPYMGFEAGSTKIRQAQDGSIVKFVFESPLVRLMKDYGYRDVYAAGAEQADKLPARSVVIHRYYDEADPPSAPARHSPFPKRRRRSAAESRSCATASAATTRQRARRSACIWSHTRWAD